MKDSFNITFNENIDEEIYNELQEEMDKILKKHNITTRTISGGYSAEKIMDTKENFIEGGLELIKEIIPYMKIDIEQEDWSDLIDLANTISYEATKLHILNLLK